MQPEQRRSGSHLNKFLRKTKLMVHVRRLLFGPAFDLARYRMREATLNEQEEVQAHEYDKWRARERELILRAYAKQLREHIRELGGEPLAEPSLDVVKQGYTPAPSPWPAKVELPPKPGVKPRPK